MNIKTNSDVLEQRELKTPQEDWTYYENMLVRGYFPMARIALKAISTVDLNPEPLVKEPVLSVEETGVACRICGEKRNTLKRHLRASHGIEEDDYKAMFPDAKTVSESYSSLRSKVAVDMKLGH